MIDEDLDECGMLGTCWHSCILIGTTQCEVLCRFRSLRCTNDPCDGHTLVAEYYEDVEDDAV